MLRRVQKTDTTARNRDLDACIDTVDERWFWLRPCDGRNRTMKRLIVPALAVATLSLGLAGCTNPYDPGQRAIGGGLIGAGAGAALGAAAGGGPGAALGAAIGAGVGAATGIATTPPSYGYGYAPPPPYYAPPPRYYYPPPPPPRYYYPYYY
jgi:hypothetical protein